MRTHDCLMLSGEDEQITVAVSYWPEDGNPVKHAARESLESRGDVELHWLDPRVEHPELQRDGVDMYHMAKQRQGSMEDIRGFEENGTGVINTGEAVEAANDRVRSTEQLEKGGVPVPEWEFGTEGEVDIEPPAIVKDPSERFDTGYDHQIFLDEEISYDGEKLVQRYHDGITVKGYRVPHRRERPGVYAELLDGHRNEGGEEVSPSPRLEGIVEDVHEATGLGMFEVDVILTGEDEYLVCDVNPFVSLRPVADASRLYADAVADSAPRTLQGYGRGEP